MEIPQCFVENKREPAREGLNKKRCHSLSDISGRKLRRVVEQPPVSPSLAGFGFRAGQHPNTRQGNQLPSPCIPGLYENSTANQVECLAPKQKARSIHNESPTKKAPPLSEPSNTQKSVHDWLFDLPSDREFEEMQQTGYADDMSQPPSKRPRSSDTLSRNPSQSGDETEITISRDKQYGVYKDPNYATVLATKGSFMKDSKDGLTEEDLNFCDELCNTSQPVPHDLLFNEQCFESFHSNLQGRSEFQISIHLHPRIVPSAENLCIMGQEEFQGLIEGFNDPWIKSIPFYGPRPQPDHTYGFKWSNFTEPERRKMMINPTQKSRYTAREDIYFPFLTCEIKCGRQALDDADRANAHSMTVALLGIVDLYRKANRVSDLHRKAMAFSISHDENYVRMYAHYPEINGEKTTFWRHKIKEIVLGNERGKDRWLPYQFTINVCQLFALPLLERHKIAINALQEPTLQPFELSATLHNASILGSQEQSSASGSQAQSSRKPRGGLNAELRNTIQTLQRQLEQQRLDHKEREATWKEHMAKQEELHKEQMAKQEEQAMMLKQLLNRG